MIKFEVGKRYMWESFQDHTLRKPYTVLSRTACTVKVTDGKEIKTCRVTKMNFFGDEYESIYPCGRSTLSAGIRAKDVIEDVVETSREDNDTERESIA